MKFLRFKQKKTKKKTTKFWAFVVAVPRNEFILRELIFSVCKKSVYFTLALINGTKTISLLKSFFVNFLKSHICFDRSYLRRPSSRPLLRATITHNIVH